MRFGHDRYDGHTRSRADGFGFQKGPQLGAIRNGEALENIGHFGDSVGKRESGIYIYILR